MMLPVPTECFAKVRVMLAFEATPVALSAGELDERVGAIISAAVKLSDVALLMPRMSYH